MLLQQVEYRAFEEERVVDRFQTDAGNAVPARTTSTRLGGIHYVVRNQGTRLCLIDVIIFWQKGERSEQIYQLDAPPQNRCLKVFFLTEYVTTKDLNGVDHGEAAKKFAAENVVLERLYCRTPSYSRAYRGRLQVQHFVNFWIRNACRRLAIFRDILC